MHRGRVMILKKLLKIAALIFGAFMILLTALALLGVSISLDFVKPDLEKIVQKNIGRKVTFAGPITLGVSLWPRLTLKDVQITNPAGFKGDLASAGLMDVRVDLLPLLSGDLRLGRIAAKNVKINLGVNKAGKNNWHFELPKEESGKSQTDQKSGDSVTVQLKEVRELSLEDIKLIYTFRGEQPIIYKLKSLRASGTETKPLKLQAKGDIAGTPVTLTYQAVLGPETQEETRFRKGRWASHELSSEMELTVGQSHLRGKGRLWETGQVLGLEAELVSKSIQLNDFIAPTHIKGRKIKAIRPEEPDQAVPSKSKDGTPAVETRLAAKLRAWMRNSDIDISVRADKVLSGKDELGGGELALKIKDGRMSLKPAEVRIPGGKVAFELDLDGREKLFKVQLGVQAQNFDLGVIANRIKPDNKAGGVLNLNVQLSSRTPDLAQLLRNASGHFYFAVQPINIPADLFDLWAVNLVTAILPRLDKDSKSKINCLVGRMKMKDGLMTDEIIIMDTTRMTVEGKGKIDFKERRAEFVFKPHAKQPEFFAAATPVTASGPFNDFSVDVTTMDLVLSMFSMATSPVHVPVRRIFSQSPTPDGKEVCAQAMSMAVADKIAEKNPAKKRKAEPALAND